MCLAILDCAITFAVIWSETSAAARHTIYPLPILRTELEAREKATVDPAARLEKKKQKNKQ